MYGGSVYSKPSRFIDEIPVKFVERVETDKKGRTNVDNRPKNSSDLYREIFERKSVTVREVPFEYDFKAGDMVTHKKFGKGMILSVTPAGGDVKLEIVFDEAGTKSLMGSFAKLTKI